jgi:hypothetical protein
MHVCVQQGGDDELILDISSTLLDPNAKSTKSKLSKKQPKQQKSKHKNKYADGDVTNDDGEGNEKIVLEL